MPTSINCRRKSISCMSYTNTQRLQCRSIMKSVQFITEQACVSNTAKLKVCSTQLIHNTITPPSKLNCMICKQYILAISVHSATAMNVSYISVLYPCSQINKSITINYPSIIPPTKKKLNIIDIRFQGNFTMRILNYDRNTQYLPWLLFQKMFPLWYQISRKTRFNQKPLILLGQIS